jgi:hypothetical protein
VGVADIGFNRTIYKWGSDATSYRPVSASSVAIYKKRDIGSGP